ncbi:hypothetical protein ABPG74_020537 [Tetrahymena malaccensis]
MSNQVQPIESEPHPLCAMNENLLFSSNKKQGFIQESSAKHNYFNNSQSDKKKGLSSNKENSSSTQYVKEGLISLHFNNKSEMVVQPFSSQNAQARLQQLPSFKQANLNQACKTADKMFEKKSNHNLRETESAIQIELSPGWTASSSISQSHVQSEKSEMQEEEAQEMTGNGIARSELKDVVRNLNLIDLAKTEDESPMSQNLSALSSSNLFRSESNSSTTSDQFLREISTNILNQNSQNDFITLDKKQKFYKKCNFDRFIPSRVESDTYKLFQIHSQMELDQANHQQNFQSQQQNSNNNIKEEQNRQLYHNLLHAHFLESNTVINHNYCSPADDTSLFASAQESGSKQSQFKPMKKLFSYGENNSSSNMQQNNNSSLSSFIPPSSSSSSSKKSSIYQSLINLPDNNMYMRDETPKLKINPRPYKILEAPTLKNDFYLNLLDWSASNLVSVGLENYVYVLSGANQSVKTQFTIPEYVDHNLLKLQSGQEQLQQSDYYNMVCSVGWSQISDHISVGDRQGKVYLFDLTKNKFLRVMHNHTGRVGQIAWNGHLIATGSRDKNIIITDIRDKSSNSIVFKGHEQEICGMRWSFDEQTLASGGNDNKVFLWSLKMNGKLAKISSSKAAVKAIGFSPHQHNILAFGGGTADRCIRIYDTQQLKQIECIDTGSQVCNLIFSKNSRQIISTHGYSLNHIQIWNQSNMKKLATLTGHTQRVLYLAESPCGQNILTGAADETIRFWNIYKNDTVNELSPSSLGLR